MNMCTKQETKQAIAEVLHETNEDGDTIIGREVNGHVDRKLNDLVRYINVRYGVGLLVFAFVLGGAWYSQSIRLEQVEERLEEGGRYTQEEHDTYAVEVDRRFLELDDDLEELKTDIRIIRDAVVGY